MSLEALGDLGDFVGGIAVVATLLLPIQRELWAWNRDGFAAEFVELVDGLVEETAAR